MSTAVDSILAKFQEAAREPVDPRMAKECGRIYRALLDAMQDREEGARAELMRRLSPKSEQPA